MMRRTYDEDKALGPILVPRGGMLGMRAAVPYNPPKGGSSGPSGSGTWSVYVDFTGGATDAVNGAVYSKGVTVLVAYDNSPVGDIEHGYGEYQKVISALASGGSVSRGQGASPLILPAGKCARVAFDYTTSFGYATRTGTDVCRPHGTPPKPVPPPPAPHGRSAPVTSTRTAVFTGIHGTPDPDGEPSGS